MLVLVLAFIPRVIGGQIQEMLFRKELLPAVPEDGRRVYTRTTKDLWGGKGVKVKRAQCGVALQGTGCWFEE